MKILFQTNVGPILVCVNPYTDVGNPLTLTSTRSVPLAPQLNKVVQEAVRQQSETGYPQAIILSGKTLNKLHLLSFFEREDFQNFFCRDKRFRKNVRFDAITQATLRRRRRRTGNGRFQTPSGSLHGPQILGLSENRHKLGELKDSKQFASKCMRSMKMEDNRKREEKQDYEKRKQK